MPSERKVSERKYLSSNTVEVRFDIQRMITQRDGDAWLRDFVRRGLEQMVQCLEGGEIRIDSVRIVD